MHDTPLALLRKYPVFRWLWLATLATNIGAAMQMLGAQWFLVHEPNAAVYVSLVQSAASLPIALFSLPAGVLADSFDRRKMLLFVQCAMVFIGLLLTGLMLTGQMTPILLLLLTVGLGVGSAVTFPTYGSMIPSLVGREQITTASALGALNFNLGRALGPAIAGWVIAWSGIAAVFAINMLTFVIYVIILLRWKRGPQTTNGPRERFAPALRAGGRYVRHSPGLRRIIVRVVTFAVPGIAVWSLIPLIATQRFGLESEGTGILLTALGGGAAASALLLPRVRNRFPANTVIVASVIVHGLATVLLLLTPSLWLAIVLLIPIGATWTGALSSTFASMQLYLPEWVRARGIGVFQIFQFSAIGGGAFLWGVIADGIGAYEAVMISGILTMLAGVLGFFVKVPDTQALDRSPAVYWEAPDLVVEPDDTIGPVSIEVEYHVIPELQEEFLEAMQGVRRIRLRTGATSWALYREGEVENRFVEQYVVGTWGEHMRQHNQRLTGADRSIEEHVMTMSDPPPASRHLLPAEAVVEAQLHHPEGT